MKPEISEARLPIPLGTFVMPFGKVEAITYTGGERYYMMIGHDGATALMPASVIEPAAIMTSMRRT